MFSQEALPVLQECEARGIEVHIAGAFRMGVIEEEGGDEIKAKFGVSPESAARERWAELAAKHGVALPAVALAWAFAPACVTKIVLGVATPAHVEENVASLQATADVPPALWAEAAEMGLLDAACPLPGR